MGVLTPMKRSAVHNLRVDAVSHPGSHDPLAVDEGLFLPRELMRDADLAPWERVTVARVAGGLHQNRVETFVQTSRTGRVEVAGSLAVFIEPAELVCVISETMMTDEQLALHSADALPVVDCGSPLGVAGSAVRWEFLSKETHIAPATARTRDALPRWMMRNYIGGLVVTETHPDCLHGSAEVPGSILDRVGLTRHRMVTVYNVASGSAARTYAVPVREGLVQTTGGMAGFAPEGSTVNVAHFALSAGDSRPLVVNAVENRV